MNENNEGNQIHNFIFCSGSGTVINYSSGSDFLTNYGSGSTSQKVTVPMIPVPVPQHWLHSIFMFCDFLPVLQIRIRIRVHRIYMFLGLLDPDSSVRGISNKEKKTFLKIRFLLGQRHGPRIPFRIRIHTKMSWIRNIVFFMTFYL